MQALTVRASSFEVAQGLYAALLDYGPEIIGDDSEGYQVSVSLQGGDRRIIGILDALEEHVSKQNKSAQVQLGPRTYVLHPETTGESEDSAAPLSAPNPRPQTI
jgi:hypothetical protein